MAKSIRQIVLPLVAAIIWGTAFVVQGDVADKISPFTFNGSRMIIAALVLFGIILAKEGVKKKKLGSEYKKPDVKKAVIGGVFCGVVLTVAVNLQQWGITLKVRPAMSAFITTLYMIFVPIFGLFFGKKTSASVWIALLIAVPALYFVCGVKDFSFDAGTLLMILCAVMFAVHILVVDRFTQDCDGFVLSCVQFFVGGVISLVCALIFEKISFAALFENGWQILYVGAISSAAGYTLQIEAQKGTNPTCVCILLCLESVFALIAESIIYAIRGQSFVYEPLRYLGCALMLVAVVVAQIDVDEIIEKVKNNKKGK